MNIYEIIIIGIAVFLNIVLLKNVLKAFAGRGLWLLAALCSAEAACYLIPYFAGGRVFYLREITEGTVLFLFCYAVISKTKTRDGEAEDAEAEKTGGKRAALLTVIPAAGFGALLCLFLGDLKPYFLSAICCGCILAADLCVFYLYCFLVQNDTHVRQRDIYRQQTDHYRNQLNVIEESGNRLRALRHDMKNHILHLGAELRQGNYEDAAQYLKKMEEELQNPAEHVRTGNREIDSLLNYKLQKAAQVLTAVESDINVPVEFTPKSFDINVILGNLLDNAIEAAQGSEGKRLKLVLRADRGVLFIYIANSCSEPPKKSGRGFFTTKKDAGGHGIGLRNVRRMVERQNGSIAFDYADGVFSVEVMLYMSEV